MTLVRNGSGHLVHGGHLFTGGHGLPGVLKTSADGVYHHVANIPLEEASDGGMGKHFIDAGEVAIPTGHSVDGITPKE
jgi:hypothetical protein